MNTCLETFQGIEVQMILFRSVLSECRKMVKEMSGSKKDQLHLIASLWRETI